LAAEDGGVAEGVGEEGGTLDAGEESNREVACVRPAELAELIFRPIDDRGDYLGGVAVEAVLALVELGSERAHRAAVTHDRVAHVDPVPDERFEPGLRGSAPLERGDEDRGFLLVAGEHRT